MLIKTEMCTVVVQTKNVQPTGTKSNQAAEQLESVQLPRAALR